MREFPSAQRHEEMMMLSDFVNDLPWMRMDRASIAKAEELQKALDELVMDRQ